MTTPPPGPPGPPPGWPGQQAFPPPPYPPAPGLGQPGYPPPGYGGAPPGYPLPGPVGYPPAAAWKPGVIPLRALSLGEIFSGALAYMRAHPMPTLGLSTAVVPIASVAAFGLNVLLAGAGSGAVATAVAGGVATLLATTLLAGMLTVIIARSVLGLPVTVADTWRRLRGRLPALIGLTALEAAAGLVLVGGTALVMAAIAKAADSMLAVMIGIPLGMLVFAAITFLSTMVVFAPAAIVLERNGIAQAVRRSIALVRGRFWRVLGIVLLAATLTGLIAGVIAFPFGFVGGLLSIGMPVGSLSVAGTVVSTVGEAVGRTIVAPFAAGVTTLLYVDARIRSEAFDFALRSAASGSVDADGVWLRP